MGRHKWVALGPASALLVFLWTQPTLRIYASWGTGLVVGYLLLLMSLAVAFNWLQNRGYWKTCRWLGTLVSWLIFQNRYQRRCGAMASFLTRPREADRLWQEMEHQLTSLDTETAHHFATNYAAALIGDGRYRQAIQVLERSGLKLQEAIRQQTLSPMAVAMHWNNLACAHTALGQVSEARACLDEAWKIAPAGLLPNYLDYNEALLCQVQDDLEGARCHLKAITTAAGRPSPSSLACAWACLGSLEEARALLPAKPPLGRPYELTSYYLALAIMSEEPEPLLWQALGVGSPSGMLAWQALQLLGAEGARPFLEGAENYNPESVWTRRCGEASDRLRGSQREDAHRPTLQPTVEPESNSEPLD